MKVSPVKQLIKGSSVSKEPSIDSKKFSRSNFDDYPSSDEEFQIQEEEMLEIENKRIKKPKKLPGSKLITSIFDSMDRQERVMERQGFLKASQKDIGTSRKVTKSIHQKENALTRRQPVLMQIIKTHAKVGKAQIESKYKDQQDQGAEKENLLLSHTQRQKEQNLQNLNINKGNSGLGFKEGDNAKGIKIPEVNRVFKSTKSQKRIAKQNLKLFTDEINEQQSAEYENETRKQQPSASKISSSVTLQKKKKVQICSEDSDCGESKGLKATQCHSVTSIKENSSSKQFYTTTLQKSISKRSQTKIYDFYGNKINTKWENGQINGYTEIRYNDGGSFQGVFLLGEIITGKMTFPNGFAYEGEFSDNIFHGIGKLFFPKKIKHRQEENQLTSPENKGGSQKQQNRQQSSQKQEKPLGLCYYSFQGEWSKGKLLEDSVTIKYPSGDMYYGPISNFKRHGEGFLYFSNGDKYSGEFQNGQIFGMGGYYNKKGELLKQGYWINGKYIKGGYQEFCLRTIGKEKSKSTSKKIRKQPSNEFDQDNQKAQNRKGVIEKKSTPEQPHPIYEKIDAEESSDDDECPITSICENLNSKKAIFALIL